MRERWSISKLHEETLIDPKTLRKIMRDTIPTEDDNRFYISEFVEAYRRHLFNKTAGKTLEIEKTRLIATQADIAEVQRAKVRYEVINVDAAFHFFSQYCNVIRRVIELSLLSIPDKDRIFEQLESIDLDAIIQATLEQERDTEETGQTMPGDLQEAGETNGQPMG